jgi:hypothetical protein
MTEDDEGVSERAPGCGIAALALTASAVLIAAGITVVSDLGSAYPFVLWVTLFIVAVTGVPAFAQLRERPTWQSIAVAGFLAGAIVPAVLGLSLLAQQPASYFAGVGGFGVAGIAGAMIVWLFVRWLQNGGWIAKAAVGLIIVAGVAAMWVVPSMLMDRSCHNPLRDGRRSIGATAGFDLHVTMAEWRDVEAEFEQFARESGWDMQSDVRPDFDFPWFQISVCTEPGTEIAVHKSWPDTGPLSIFVMQPQGGNSWQIPLKRVQERLERRWPGKIGYDGNTPRPPWASPTPEPSHAPLHPNEKSL